MAETGKGFDAGSIFVALKTQISDLEKGLTKAKSLLGQFGDKTEQTGSQVTKAGKDMAVQFDKNDRQNLKFAERFSRLTNRLVGVQFAMQGLQGEASKGGKAIEVATKGLGIFLGTAALFPTPVGLAAGAVLGLGVAFKAATAAGADTVEVLKNAKDTIEAFKSGVRERELQSAVAERLKSIFPDQKDVHIMTEIAEQISTIRRITSEQVGLEKQLTELHNQRKKINETLEDETLGFKDEGLLGVLKQVVPGFMETKMARLTGELGDIDKQILQLQRNSGRVAKALKEAGDALPAIKLREGLKDVEKITDEFAKQTEDLKKQATILPDFVSIERARLDIVEQISKLEKGVSDPKALEDAKRARERSNELAGKRAIELASQGRTKIDKEITKASTALQEEIEPLTRLQEIDNFRKETVEKLVELRKSELMVLGKSVDEAQLKAEAEERVKKDFEALQKKANQADFKDLFAEPASAGVAAGLVEGVLEARNPIQAIGENLFSNMVNSFAGQLQKQLTTALTSAFGAGGSALANLFTGIVGLAGLFMSRKKSGSTQSFDATDNRIESAAAVRGIVAGPTSVSIAAVGEDLQRALIPTNEILTRILSAVRGRGGQGPSGAGGFQFGGTAPTT